MIRPAILAAFTVALTAPALAGDNSVNSQITDAVTQTNVKVVGESPAIAISQLYQIKQNPQSQALPVDATRPVSTPLEQIMHEGR